MTTLTHKERTELARLQKKWAAQKATKKEILRCMELERKHAAIVKEAMGK